MEKSNKYYLYLVLIFALGLRLYGIDQKVPHPDDYITVQAAMHFGVAQIAPTQYGGLYGLYIWPALTMVYLQIVLQSIFFAVGWISGLFPDIDAFRNYYYTHPQSFYLIGKIMCVGFGACSIWLLYIIGKLAYHQKTGLLAAFFLSISFIHSFHSQFIRPDVIATCFMLLVIWCSMKIMRNGNIKYYIGSGVFTGLSIVTKFTSGIILLPIVAAHIIREAGGLREINPKFKKMVIPFVGLAFIGAIIFGGYIFTNVLNLHMWILKTFLPGIKQVPGNIELLEYLLQKIGLVGVILVLFGIVAAVYPKIRNVTLKIVTDKKLLASAVALIATFVFFDPIFFLDIKKQIYLFATDSNFLGKHTNFVGIDSYGFLGNLWWYMTGPISWGAGAHILLLSILGIAFFFSTNKKDNLIILIPALVYLIAICAGKFRWERYAVTLMPFTALYASIFLNQIYALLLRKKPHLPLKIMSIVTVAAISIFPIYNIIRYDYLLSQKDTRVISKEWVEENIPTGSKIGYDAYSGEISDELFDTTRNFSLGARAYSYYIENNYQYLMVSDTQYQRFMAEPEKQSNQVKFYNSLFEKGELVKTIESKTLWPYPDVRFKKYHIHISPTIRIFRIQS